MKNGSIFLYSGRRARTWFEKVIAWAIMTVTRSEYTHVALWLAGHLWEVTVWHTGKGWIFGWRQGVRCHEGIPTGMMPDAIYEPVQELTEWDAYALARWLGWTRDEGYNYGVGRLLVFALVYPTRALWRWIGWVPFRRHLMAEVCSTYPAEGYQFLGRDVLEGVSDEMIVPGSYAKSPAFRLTELVV